MLGHEFMRNAYLAGTFIALACGAIGWFVVLRAQVFAGDALSHVAFAGALGAAAIGIDIRLGLFAATVVVGAGIGGLGERARADDVVIGTVFAWILGLGALFLAVFVSGSSGSDGTAAVRVLFGSILGLSAGDGRLAAVIAIAACLALVAPEPTLAALLTASRVADEVPVYADTAHALSHLADRPLVVREGWRFEVDPHAPGRARSYIRDLCRRWGLEGEVREAAEIVITELVTNAVEHATSPSVVEVERHGDAFRVAVRDYDTGRTGHDVPEATTWHAPPTSSPRGRGLAMVAAVSHTWGVLRHPDGKTVWAEMAT